MYTLYTPQESGQEPPADVVADFIAVVKKACAEAGTVAPSFVANHQAGDQVLYSSPTKEYPSTHRHWRKTGLTHAREHKPLARADYEYDVTDDNIIIVIDLDLGNMSVTNDIENVLADIAEQRNRVSLADFLVIYRDSQGIWNEVQLTCLTGSFARFTYLGGDTEEQALTILRTRYGL